MTGPTHRVRLPSGWADLPTAAWGDEALILPGVAALVHPDDSCEQVLLQRRDKPGEEIRGRFELPAGKWRAGETAYEAVIREVREETGLDAVPIGPDAVRHTQHPDRPVEVIAPLTVVSGVGGAYPVLLVVFACVAHGSPRGSAGESRDPAYYSRSEVASMLESPDQFTDPAYAILRTWLLES
ncbi:NUDIX hydrolase [bacterium]|nr:NUDIX hydrolase [bacterium]